MNTSELKLQLFRQIDLLDKNQLNELSGILTNLVHGDFGVDDWENLSTKEKEGILDSIKQFDVEEGIPHEVVIKRIQEKFTNV